MGECSTLSSPRMNVAIIGGGIIGVMTALGLIRRDIDVTIYERASDFHEISAGFGFTGTARECMQRIDPAILETLSRISQKTSSSANTRYWDSFHARNKQDAENETFSLLFQMPERNLAFWGAVRSHLLLGMAALLPEGVMRFDKELVGYEDEIEKERVHLRFADGSVADTDLLIGCDGIHSTTRKLLFGEDHPASRPSYSRVVAYRTMVPIEYGIKALGEDKAMSACMHCAPDVNMMSYPVLNGKMLNIAIFAHDPSDFAEADRMTAPATRDEVERAVSGLSPHMADVAKLFPEKMVKWGIFDMYDHPAPTYARGLICIAGDAAHASSPHQGVGACMGVEDALVLSEVLESAQASIRSGTDKTPRRTTIERALNAFSSVRMERSQWLVRSSREMGEMYQWRYGPTGRDTKRCHSKIEKASRRLWDFDVEKLVAQAKSIAVS